MTDEGGPATDGMGRRVVLARAAWSLPIIVLAVSTPVAVASPVTGAITFSPRRYVGVRNDDRVEFPPVTGTVTVSSGPLPARAFVNFSDADPSRADLRRDAGRYAPIDAATGRFEFAGIYNAIVGGENPFGFFYVGIEDEDTRGAIYGYDVTELNG